MTDIEKIKKCFDNLKRLQIGCEYDVDDFGDLEDDVNLKDDIGFMCGKSGCKRMWIEKLNVASGYGCPYCGPIRRDADWNYKKIDSLHEIIKKLKLQIKKFNMQSEQDKQDKKDKRIKELIQTNNSLNQTNNSLNEMIKKLKLQIEESNVQSDQDWEFIKI